MSDKTKIGIQMNDTREVTQHVYQGDGPVNCKTTNLTVKCTDGQKHFVDGASAKENLFTSEWLQEAIFLRTLFAAHVDKLILHRDAIVGFLEGKTDIRVNRQLPRLGRAEAARMLAEYPLP